MIVRIAAEGQYRVSDELMRRLNDLDNGLVGVVASGDKAKFEKLFGEMINLVRRDGQALPDEELVESDCVLPAADTRLDEARDLFVEDGLIPG